jgi:hypothetical protein
MRFLVSSLLIGLLSFAFCIYLPWWFIAVVGFTVSMLIRQRPVWAFLSGFLSLFLLWGGMSLWISVQNNHILAHRLSMIIIQKDQPYLLMLITACIGGIVGGLAALSGSLFHKKPALVTDKK